MSPMTDSLPSLANATPSSGGRLVSTEGLCMPFVGCSLEVDACGGLARVLLRQTFINESDEPLQATYQMPLPPDAAVGAYTFTVGDIKIAGVIEGRETAREQFEEAILEGRSAALLEEDRSSLFTQELGNIPPHTEVTCELTLDQTLRWLADGQWEWRFPTVIAPRFLGEEGRVPDSERITVDVAQQDLFPRAALSMMIRDAPAVDEPTSPTHDIVAHCGDDLTNVALVQENGVALDRDIVVRWATAAPDLGVSLSVAPPTTAKDIADAAYGLLTLTPPLPDHSQPSIPRDLIILIDTSGSMSGEPLEQAKMVVLDLIASLTPRDRFELIEFSMQPRRWKKAPCVGDKKRKSAASDWVRSLEADGYTEMRSGLLEALSPLRPEAQRQVLLVTDGLVGFENEIVALVREKTPKGVRVHTIGIGPASNRSLTGAVALAGGGAEFIVGLDDDVRQASSRIVARTSSPLCIDVVISGSALIETARHSIPDLLGGAPAQIPLKLRPAGGELLIEGRTADGPWTQRLDVGDCNTVMGSESIPRLFAREKVEELEIEAATGEDVDDAIEQIGLGFGISTRMTSWVAISEEPMVDPTAPVRRVRVPQQLPAGMSAEGLGLRKANRHSSLFQRLADYPEVLCMKASNNNGARASRRSRPSRPVRIRKLQSFANIHDIDNDDNEDERGFDLPAGPLMQIVYGDIISFTGGRLVIEIEIDEEEVEWRPSIVSIAEAEQATIDPAATTRPGVYSPGQRLRLVITGLPFESMPNSFDQVEVHMEENAKPVMIGLSST